MQPIDLTEHDIVAIWETNQDSLVLAEEFKIPQKLVDLIKSGKYGSQYTRDLVKSKIPPTNQAKLTEKQILEIIQSNEPSTVLAKRFGLRSTASIRNVRSGRTWKQYKNVPRNLPPKFNVAKGEGHSTARLTEVQVKRIIQLFPTHSNSKLAKMFNVSASCISSIRKGDSWCHLTSGKKFPKSNGLCSNQHPRRKLTQEIIKTIHESDKTNSELAKLYGVKTRAIWAVRTQRTWKNSENCTI